MSKIINTVPSTTSTLAIKAFGPLAEFLAEMEIGISGDRYRDLKTGRMVGRAVVLDLFALWGRNKPIAQEEEVVQPEMDYKDSPTGIVEVADEDLFRALPDWGSMTLEEILLSVCYVKSEAHEGIVIRTPMRDADGNLIPVRKDPVYEPSMGKNTWGEESPSDVALNRAARAESLLMEWGYDVDKFLHDIEVACASQSVWEKSPFTSAEDILEAMTLREQEKLERDSLEFRRWLIRVFGKDTAKKVWKDVKATFYCAVQEAKEFAVDFDEKCAVISILQWGGLYIDQKWEKANGPHIWSSVEKHLPTGGYVQNDTKKKFNSFFKRWFWAEVRTGMSDAVKGTLLRWMGSLIQVALLEALAEDKHVDREAVNLMKTNWSDYFRKEDADWVWSSRDDRREPVQFHEFKDSEGTNVKIKSWQLTTAEVTKLLK